LQFCDENGYIKPNIHISIDWNEEIHDRQRWIRWSFKKSIETIIKLKQQYKNINIKLKYTITKDNIKYIKFAYTLSRKIWVDISYKLVENDVNYTNRLSYPCLLDDKEKRIVIQNLFELYWNSDKYINNLIYYIKNKNLNFECKTPKVSLFIMANWDVYSCIKYNSIWNIKSGNLDSIINSEASKAIIKEVKDTKCNNCYSLHGSYKSII
jgi:MoaA/NifB/PqqE/SkfB family radical SAM enzyme